MCSSDLVILVKPIQSEKAAESIVLRFAGKVILVKSVQPEKTAVSILARFVQPDRSNLFKLVQSEKAPRPILVRFLQPDRFTLFKPEQPEKAASPILVRLAGSVSPVKPVQSLKAVWYISVITSFPIFSGIIKSAGSSSFLHV